MSDELLEYSARKQSTTLLDDAASDAPAKKGGLNRLSTIFLVVLGLHVVVIVGISAYHLLRGNPDTGITSMDPAPAAEMAKTPEAAPAPEVASSMPSPDDKVWQAQAPAEASAPVAAAPAPTAPVAEMAPIPAAERMHVVVKGDTLGKIAKANGVTAAALAKANGIDGTMIRIGQKLKIPEVAGAGTDAKPMAAPASAPRCGFASCSRPKELSRSPVAISVGSPRRRSRCSGGTSAPSSRISGFSRAGPSTTTLPTPCR